MSEAEDFFSGHPGDNSAELRYQRAFQQPAEPRNSAALDSLLALRGEVAPEEDPIRATLRSLGFQSIPEERYRDLNAEAEAVASQYKALTDRLSAAVAAAPKVTESRTLQTSMASKSQATNTVKQAPQPAWGLTHEQVKDLRERMFVDPETGRPYIYETGTVKEAADAREQGANVLRLTKIADKIRELETITDSRIYAQTRDALLQQAATTISKLQGQGAMTDDERKAYDEMFRSVPLFNESKRGGANALRAWVEQYENFHTGLVRRLGVREVDPRFYRRFIANPGATRGGQ